MVRNALIALILLPLIIVALAPKKELYFLLEQELAKQHIVISDETITEGIFGLSVEGAVVYFDGASVATAQRIEIWSLLLYTSIDFTDLEVAQGLPTEIKVDTLNATHSILSPLVVDISANTSIGVIEGRVDADNGVARLDVVEPSNSIKRFKKYLKKDDKGWYYEQKI